MHTGWPATCISPNAVAKTPVTAQFRRPLAQSELIPLSDCLARTGWWQTWSNARSTLCKVSSYAIARIRRPTMATGTPPELSSTPRQQVTSRYCHDFPYFGHAQSKMSGNPQVREQNPVAFGERTPDGRVSLPPVSTYTRLVQCHSKKLLQLRLSSHNLRTIQLSHPQLHNKPLI